MDSRTEMGVCPPHAPLVLPGGLLTADDQWLREVRVRPLIGHDEERLADRRGAGGAEDVSAFLADVLQDVPGYGKPADREFVDQLPIGDRDYLLLRLRQQAIGDRVHQIMRCPSLACGEKVDVEFLISEVLVRRLESRPASYELGLAEPVTPDSDTPQTVELRLPDGRDQLAVDTLANTQPGRAATALFSRIVLRIGADHSVDEESIRALPLGARRQLSHFLGDIVPGPDLDIDIACPHCAADMTYPFDLHSFFLTSGA